MKIGLYFRKKIDHLIRMADNIATFVLANGSEVFISPEITDMLPQYPTYCSSHLATKPDALLSLGGDGTFLHAAQYALLEDIPIIGINFGFTGFLTNIEKEEIYQSLELILNGAYSISSNSSLKASIFRNGELIKSSFCLNDFVLQKDPIEKILQIELYMATQKIASFRGDGLIVATPSGSTAYSLSAGGPVVDPCCKVYLLTPLCSHNLTGRTLIVHEKEKIYANVLSKGEKTRFIRDGTEEFFIKDLDRIMIQRYHRSLKMIVLQEKNFYHTLNQKFQWGF